MERNFLEQNLKETFLREEGRQKIYFNKISKRISWKECRKDTRKEIASSLSSFIHDVVRRYEDSSGLQIVKQEGTSKQPFIEGDGGGGRRLAKEAKPVREGKGKNEAECGDCDAFRSGAALTILLLPTSIQIHSFTYFYPPSFAFLSVSSS